MNELLRSWNPRPEDWDRATALHLFRRAGFGAGRAELDQALSDGLELTLERLFEDRTEPELFEAELALLGTQQISWLQTLWMTRILAGCAPLRERMTLLWHGLFATSQDKVDDVRRMQAQHTFLRQHALGDFRTLLHGIARDPAMLVWLDGNSNRRDRPNENFARELLELFALGPGHYSERDVQEAARAFSGWSTDALGFVDRREHHDDGEKTILGRTGAWDGAQALDIVLAHPACARHVARVLLEAFVSPAVRPEWIDALAAHVQDSGWDLGAALRILLRSRLFFSSTARRARIAAPVECLAVAHRASGSRLAPCKVAQYAAEMGQALFRPPSVKGWEGGRAWINSGQWIARHNALVEIARESKAPSRSADASELLWGLLPEEPLVLKAVVERRLASKASRDAAWSGALATVLTSPEFQLF